MVHFKTVKTKLSQIRTKGFSLVEILIVLGLMGISAMVMASMFSYQFRSQRLMMKKMDLSDLRRVATEVMTGNVSCRCNLNAQNIPFASMGSDATRNVSEIRYNFADDSCAGSSLLASPQNPPTNNLIERIQIENVSPLAVDTYSYELAFYPRIDPGETSLAPVRITNLMAQLDAGSVARCGSSGALDQGLAGLSCPEDEFLVGFNIDGSLDCQPASSSSSGEIFCQTAGGYEGRLFCPADSTFVSCTGSGIFYHLIPAQCYCQDVTSGSCTATLCCMRN